MGLSPSLFAFASVVIRHADAPSVRNEALAAVIVPCGLTKAGLSLARASFDETRIPLSLFTVCATPLTILKFKFINKLFHEN